MARQRRYCSATNVSVKVTFIHIAAYAASDISGVQPEPQSNLTVMDVALICRFSGLHNTNKCTYYYRSARDGRL